ncbi:hypothetical protein [Paenibacillus nasutitermitis]|uniref:DUF2802 domain-containing protein n=1 Tax=Paenibacillus nasutitermitis TaxID=1652958 RepID=A0A917DT90_9BACL|nr:hypothetical protein [Paenibacillus nasutitermitis]GGD68148.1 hypothetical protein GCM10010911_27390 [Paenibacillus nasutitermitis]
MESWQIIVLLGALSIVGAVLLPRRSGQGVQTQTVRNMETALEQFMENMEADNRDLASLVTKAQQDANQQSVRRDNRIEELELRCKELEKSLADQAKLLLAAASAAPVNQTVTNAAAPIQETTTEQQPVPEASEPEVSVPRPPTIRSRYPELFEQHDSGKSVEAIARKLAMNKGEVQLILQLSKQEEKAHHG